MNPTRRAILKWSGIALVSSPVVGILTLSISGPGLLERQRSAARREGIPLTPEDLRPNPPIPNAQNAGPLLKELTRRYKVLPEKESHDWDATYDQFGKNLDDPKARVAFQESLVRYADLVQLAEAATERPHCDLAYDWNQGMNLEFPEFAIVRRFGRLFTARASLATDASSAWADVARCAKLGNLMGQTPCLIAALVSVALHAIADKSYIATLKRFGPSPQARETLTAFGPPPKPTVYFRGEVVSCTMTLEQLRAGKLKDMADDEGGVFIGGAVWKNLSFVAPVAVPFWEKQLLFFWREAFAKARDTERTGDYEGLGKWFDTRMKVWERDKINIPQNLLVLILTPVFSQATNKTHISTLALRRLRESALALLEEKAKTGAFPDSPKLSIDPFSSTKQPLRYRKESNGCILYSVGQDHTDDGGVEKREKNSEKLDLVVRL
ncbi:hypothetical protein [Armatimonas sp.]|uniref:hypothetical protein n=1 Tax=Armatimonas sp. TaxID=1872638 RepID=UPI003751CE29